MQISIAAAGNADTNVNLIDHRYQAEALRQLRGIDCGVLNNSFYSNASDVGLTRTPNASFMWPLTASNVQNITVGRGMATAYGIDAKSESDISFTATAPSAGTKYLFIYLQWDLSNPTEGKGDLLLHDNGSSATWTPPYQDNLITNPIGRYQMPLYRLAVNTAGTITGVVSWNTLGVLTISYPLRSQHANHAEQADSAEFPKESSSADSIASRLAAINSRLDALGFRQGDITIHHSYVYNSSSPSSSGYYDVTQTNGISKQGKIVWCCIKKSFGAFSFNANDTIITIPSGFEPKDKAYFALVKTTGDAALGHVNAGSRYGVADVASNATYAGLSAGTYYIIFGWEAN